MAAARSWWGRIARYAITLAIVVLLVVFAGKVNWHEAGTAMRTASMPLLAAAMVANVTTLFFRGVRWWLLLRKAGSPSLGLAMRATFAGAGLNNILIANGGEAAKMMFISRATGLSTSRVLATVALDRLFDPIGFVVLLAAGTFAFPFPEAIERLRWPAIAIIIAMTIVLVWLSRRVQANEPPATLVAATDPIASGWRAKSRAWLAEFGRGMRDMASGSNVIWMVVLTLLAWLSQLATFYYAAEAAHVHLPFAGSLAALLAVNISLIVRATPGNVGFFQFAYTLATEPFHVDTNAAVGVSILIQALQILPITLIGIALAPEFIFKRSTRSAKQGA